MKNTLKVRNKILLAVLCVLFALSTIAIVFIGNNNADAEPVFKEQYVVDDILEFPKYTFQVGGKEYTYDTVLKYPDGQSYSCSQVSFAEAGKYTLVYSKQVDGKIYKKEYTLNVVSPTYSVTSSLSSVTYYSDYVFNYYDTQKGESGSYDTGVSGLAVSLTNGATFNYNKVIDLRELDPKEPIISYFVTPSLLLRRDMTDVIVKLTDVYDSTNCVYITCNALTYKYGISTWGNNASMMFAGTSTAELMSIRGDSVARGDTWYRYGFETWFNFIGRYSQYTNGKANEYFSSSFTYGDISCGKQFITIALDENTGKIYGPDNKDANGDSSSVDKSGEFIVSDLKDGTIYSTIWNGFTTGEVYLSLYCENYEQTTANLVINKIANEDLSVKYFEGGSTPTVKADLSSVNGVAPNAIVGKAYPLFSAKGRTVFGEEDVKPRVYYNYRSSTAIECDVISNKFVPERAGSYTIVYEISDKYGHTAYDYVNINAVASSTDFSASFKPGYSTTTKLGVVTTLAGVNTVGAVGNIDVDIEVSGQGIVEGAENGEFVFTKAGTYQLKYTVSDYIGQEYVLTYNITAESNQDLISNGELILAKRLFNNGKYIFPEYNFIDYSSGEGVLVPATVMVTDANGTHEASTPYIVKPINNQIEVQYTATIGSREIKLDKISIPVTDVSSSTDSSKLDLSKYLIPAGSATTITSASGGVVVSTQGETGGFDYAKEVIAEKSFIKFQIDKNNCAFTNVDITFTDSVNTNQSIKISFVKIDESTGKIAVFLNDSRTYASLSSSFTNGILNSVRYTNGTIKLNTTEASITLSKYLNGETFNGFSSGLVNISVRLTGVKANASIIVSQINTQALRSSVTRDNGKPDISIQGLYKVVAVPNDTITIYKAVVADVLDSYTVGSISVQDPDGNYAVSDDGIELNEVSFDREYTIKLSLLGNYSITYTVKDSKNNTQNEPVTVKVTDLEKPVITLSGSVKKTAKVGDSLDLPTASVVDNLTENIDCHIYVMDPKGVYLPYYKYDNYQIVKDGSGNPTINSKISTFAYEGKYTVSYLASDDEGNTQILIYDIIVSK